MAAEITEITEFISSSEAEAPLSGGERSQEKTSPCDTFQQDQD